MPEIRMPYLPYLGLLLFGVAAVWFVRRRGSGVITNAVFMVFAISAVWFLSLNSSGRGTPFGDFNKAYYPAGQLAYTQPARLYDCVHADGLCFVNIPIVAFWFTPLSSLSLPAAHTVVTVVSAVTVAAIVWGLIVLTGASGWQKYAIAAAVALNGPLFYSIRLGNLTHVVLLAVVAAVFLLTRSRDVGAGILLALCALAKPPLLIWLPYFVLRRQWSAALGMSGCLLFAVAVSVAWFGVDLHRVWFDQFVAASNANAVGAYNVQSINGFLVRLTTSGTLINWRPVDVGLGFRIAQAILSLVVIATALGSGIVGGAPRTKAAELREYAVVLCAMLVLSPISWTHYYCFLLLPIACYLASSLDVPRTTMWMALIATSAVLVSLPVMLWVPRHPLWGAVIARILLSHYFFGGCLLLATLAAVAVHRRWLVIPLPRQSPRPDFPAVQP
jgi:Glycosyltransferase family 87